MNNFRCAHDLDAYILSAEERQETIFAEIDRLNAIEVGFFDPLRKKLKNKKRVLKKELQQLSSDIRKVSSLYTEYTTFDAKIFLEFLRDYLSLREQEQYDLITDIQEDNFALAIATKTYPLNLFGEDYNVITTASNHQKLIDQDSFGLCLGDTDDIDDFLEVCRDKKYICLVDDDAYSLLDGPNLDECYERYPYLRDVAYSLINLKLANPKLSDEVRLTLVLNAIKPRTPHIVPKKK